MRWIQACVLSCLITGIIMHWQNKRKTKQAQHYLDQMTWLVDHVELNEQNPGVRLSSDEVKLKISANRWKKRGDNYPYEVEISFDPDMNMDWFFGLRVLFLTETGETDVALFRLGTRLYVKVLLPEPTVHLSLLPGEVNKDGPLVVKQVSTYALPSDNSTLPYGSHLGV